MAHVLAFARELTRKCVVNRPRRTTGRTSQEEALAGYLRELDALEQPLRDLLSDGGG